MSGERPDPELVSRGFMQNANRLLAGLQRLGERESNRLDADQAPSDTDTDDGSQAGRPARDPPFNFRNRSAHPHLAALMKKVEELQDVVDD